MAAIRRAAVAALRRERRARRAWRRALRRARKALRRRARRAAWTARSLARGVRLATRGELELHGVRMQLARGPLGVRAILHADLYEAREIELVAEHLAPEDRLMELGGGIGVLATWCARRIGSERVVSYEANPALREPALATFRRNGVQPRWVGAAVAPRAGYVTFHVRESFCTSSLLAGGETTPIRVEARAFDAELHAFDPTFVVMDVEGAEHELVAATDWGGVRKLVIELHPDQLGDARLAEVHGALARAGFVRRRTLGDVLYLERQPPPARAAAGEDAG